MASVVMLRSHRGEKLLRFCLCLYMTKLSYEAAFSIFKETFRNKVQLDCLVGCVRHGATIEPQFMQAHRPSRQQKLTGLQRQESLRCCTR